MAETNQKSIYRCESCGEIYIQGGCGPYDSPMPECLCPFCNERLRELTKENMLTNQIEDDTKEAFLTAVAWLIYEEDPGCRLEEVESELYYYWCTLADGNSENVEKALVSFYDEQQRMDDQYKDWHEEAKLDAYMEEHALR